MKKTKYEILEVAYSASLEEVKQAFRKKVKILHPDENNNTKTNNEELLEVLEAYEILKDEEKRNAYNRTLTKEELERINLIKNNNQKDKTNHNTTSFQILPQSIKIKDLIVRTFYDDAVAIKYVLGEKNKFGYHIKNYQNSREIYVENDCYKKCFKDGILTKKYPVTTFYAGDYPVYTPLIREGIENKILSFRNEIYIARSDCFYRKIGQNSDFEIENGFIYQKESGASFFYDSFRGTLLNITGLLEWPFEKQQIEQNKTKIKSINK